MASLETEVEQTNEDAQLMEAIMASLETEEEQTNEDAQLMEAIAAFLKDMRADSQAGSQPVAGATGFGDTSSGSEGL